MIAKHRFLVCLLAMVITAVVSRGATLSAAQPVKWKVVDVLTIDQLVVRLRFLETATLADADWLQFEFENRGTKAIEVTSVSYGLDRVCVNRETGELIVSGGMGQGQSRELFPKTTRGPIRIGPGFHRSAKHASNYAAALLGSAPADGYKVNVQIRMSVQLKDGRRAENRITERTKFDFDFLWMPPDQDDIKGMQQRLKRMLANPTNDYATGYLLGTYLKIPGVSTAITANDLIASLPPRAKLAFSGRDPILDYLNDHFHDAPGVIEYVASHLKIGDASFVQNQLMRLPDVWHDDFVEPLVQLYQKHAYIRRTVLRHLVNNGCPQETDPKLARQLSEVFIQDGTLQRLKQKRSTDATQIMKRLAMTRDQRLVAELAPLLRDKREIAVDPHLAFVVPFSQPRRICDAAMEAILTILDGKFDGSIRRRGLDPAVMTKRADEAIAELKKRLSRMPDVAKALGKHNAAGLDQKMLAVSERWKLAQNPRDFLTLKKLIKPGMQADVIREILGLPIDLVRSADQSRWLYLRPSFRMSMGDTYWLTFDNEKVSDWDVQPWNEAYDPKIAPSLEQSRATFQAELGTWDDVFVVDGLDGLIARRGAQIYSVPVSGRPPHRLGSFDRMRNATIITSVKTHGHVWLLCKSRKYAPFLVDVLNGEVIELAIDGVRITEDASPTIQSHVITGDMTAILMVAGGDRATWPRPGNRPVYFWVDLKKGESRQMPIGWDLSYFSPDLTTAVFGSQSQPRAIDTKTGQDAAVYDAKQQDSVSFNWSNTDLAQPLLDPQRKMIGITANGKPYRFDIAFQDPYIPSAKRLGDRVAFHLRGHGSPRDSRNSLWFSTLRTGVRPQLVAYDVAAYEFLSPRSCVFVATLPREDSRQAEGFVYNADTSKIWNVLDGAEGLKEGSSSVRLYPSFGGTGEHRLVLCSIDCMPGGLIGPNRDRWQRWVLISSAGKRQIVEMPDGFHVHSYSNVWLHHSGVLVVGIPQQSREKARDDTRFQLKTLVLN